jgi:uncharacterized protein YlxW (UPF0749 family)
MNRISKLLAIGLFGSALFLAACAPKPPEITKTQLSQSEEEAIQNEAQVKKLQVEKKELQKQLVQKKAELESLKQYQKQIDSE